MLMSLLIFFICAFFSAYSKISMNLVKILYKKNPSHTLSPFPPLPILFIPSFQSPFFIRGISCSPNSHAACIDLMQCAKMLNSSLSSPITFVSPLLTLASSISTFVFSVSMLAFSLSTSVFSISILVFSLSTFVFSISMLVFSYGA